MISRSGAVCGRTYLKQFISGYTIEPEVFFMKTVILAGGLGTRISEESHLKPKSMIDIGGMPILWHILKFQQPPIGAKSKQERGFALPQEEIYQMVQIQMALHINHSC